MSTPINSPVGGVEAPDGQIRVDVCLDQETVWLTQRQMGEIFGTTPENVLKHLKNIFIDGVLEETTWVNGRCDACKTLQHGRGDVCGQHGQNGRCRQWLIGNR